LALAREYYRIALPASGQRSRPHAVMAVDALPDPGDQRVRPLITNQQVIAKLLVMPDFMRGDARTAMALRDVLNVDFLVARAKQAA
jgi:hypothetical protein